MHAYLGKALAALATGAATAVMLAAPAVAAPKSLQAQINEHIAKYGGVQVSDNAIAWENGPTLVFPDTAKGEKKAPKGLGRNVRVEKAKAAGIQDATAFASPGGTTDVEGCPGGYFKTDYYCFYTDKDFGGRRLQFASTNTGYAVDWGFDNQTSSWVNNEGTGKRVHAWAGAPNGTFLWTEQYGSKASYVGDANNDRMSSWTRT